MRIHATREILTTKVLKSTYFGEIVKLLDATDAYADANAEQMSRLTYRHMN